jgi:hypothetical protein
MKWISGQLKVYFGLVICLVAQVSSPILCCLFAFLFTSSGWVAVYTCLLPILNAGMEATTISEPLECHGHLSGPYPCLPHSSLDHIILHAHPDTLE